MTFNELSAAFERHLIEAVRNAGHKDQSRAAIMVDRDRGRAITCVRPLGAKVVQNLLNKDVGSLQGSVSTDGVE